MIPYERRLQMLQLLEQKDIVTLEDFCKVLSGVSESTVRRDLKTLSAEGQITLLRGGAALLRNGSFDAPVNSKTILHVTEKEKIARYAASLVNDGEAIYLDSGSTVLRMIKHLRDKQITIVTSNALILSALQENNIDEREIQCFLLAGEIKVSTASIVGTYTNSMLRTYYFDRAFIGISGYSANAGINTPDFREAEKKQIVRANSAQSYVLADSSKDNKTTLCKVFELGEVTIISDKASELLKSSGNYMLAE